jgi:hypothetical protein
MRRKLVNGVRQYQEQLYRQPICCNESEENNENVPNFVGESDENNRRLSAGLYTCF